MKWNPYPKKQPQKRARRYLVTMRSQSRHMIVAVDTFEKRDEIRDCNDNIVSDGGWKFNDSVVAWAELPEAYHVKK